MFYETLLRKHRKIPLVTQKPTTRSLDLDQTSIEQIIPHRKPFLLLDRLTAVDLKEETVVGSRFISDSDPVFQGHFPEQPVYPGSLEIEMLGQLGLCLYHFLERGLDNLYEDDPPVSIRATRVLGAYYLTPILPETEVTLTARNLEFDGLVARVIGQALVKDQICCVAIQEGCVL